MTFEKGKGPKGPRAEDVKRAQAQLTYGKAGTCRWPAWRALSSWRCGLPCNRMGYLFVALPLAVGPVIVGLALTSFLRSSTLDPLVGLSGIALAAFYAFAWGMPAFGSFRNPVYVVSITVPIALGRTHAWSRR